MTQQTDFEQFKEQIDISKEDLYLETLSEKRESIQIKKEKLIVKNLEKIFMATLKISNKKGFQAMTMRDLSQESGISLGALYSYFKSKDDLLGMLQSQRRDFVRRMLESSIAKHKDPVFQLRAMIRTHLYVSEIMQPWFYFSFMEAKNLNPQEKQKAIDSDLWTEDLLKKLLSKGQEEKCFLATHIGLSAEVIKAMLQNWYLKRSKFRDITVEQYCDFVIDVVETYLGVKKQ